jgi:outer membrane protein assembly factor BamB
VSGDRLAIGSVNGTLWILDTRDGRIVTSHRFAPGHFLSTPATAQGRVYAATFAESIVALDLP